MPHVTRGLPLTPLSRGPIRVRIQGKRGVPVSDMPQLEGRDVKGYVYTHQRSERGNSFLFNIIALEAEVGSKQGEYT